MTEQQTYGRDSVSRGLLQALLDDEQVLVKAHQTLQQASANFDVISRRYAAMREAVRERLGTSPYSKGVQWPGSPPPLPSFEGRKFRWLHWGR